MRELRATILRGGIFAGGSVIGAGHSHFAGEGAATPVATPPVDESSATRAALVAHGWNRAAAARALGVTYETLRWRSRTAAEARGVAANLLAVSKELDAVVAHFHVA